MKDLTDAPDALAELAATCALPMEEARAMPPSVYTSPEFLALEEARIFAREWICVGRASQWATPGDYSAVEIAGRPVVVLRDGNGELRAYANVCRHRMSTLVEGEGNAKSLVCPYHAWTYGLDGCLRGAPGMGRNRAFDRSEIRLPELRLRDWQGWVLVTLDGEVPEPDEALRGAEALVSPYGITDYVQTFHERLNWNTNWKVLAENFMESYHLPVCHAATIGGWVNFEEMDCPEGTPAYNHHAILKDPDAPLTNAHPSNTTLKGDMRRQTLLLTIYPSLLITLTPGYFWYLSLAPDGVDRVSILYGGGLSPDYAGDGEAERHFREVKTLLDAVNDEDKGCTERVYRGLASGLATGGPLSHLERPLYEFAQYIHGRVTT